MQIIKSAKEYADKVIGLGASKESALGMSEIYQVTLSGVEAYKAKAGAAAAPEEVQVLDQLLAEFGKKAEEYKTLAASLEPIDAAPADKLLNAAKLDVQNPGKTALNNAQIQQYIKYYESTKNDRALAYFRGRLEESESQGVAR